MAATDEFSRMKYCLLFLVVLSLGVKKGEARSLLSKEEEDLEIERQLKTLNKPPIKTIHTEWGDILDCVDINKQPALDHPLLKDHKIQMRPSFFLKGDEKSPPSTQSDDQPSIFKMPAEVCPKGTVPIRRTYKDDLVRAKSLSSFGESKTKQFAGQSLVGLKYNISGETYYGVAAIINVYNPQLTSEDQFSSAEIAIENGLDNQINSIRVGWTVNPQLFGDHHTRFFTLWTADGYQKTGCYNILCSGFVQVHSYITPGIQITNTSVYDGEQYADKIELYQDRKTGDWWLVVQDNISVGYWPKNLFGSLTGGGNGIYWGGHVKASASGDSPPMGSGHLPDRDNYRRACYYKYMQYVDGTNTLLNPKEFEVRRIVECNHYGISYFGFQQGGFGHTFLFGGPGGNQCA